MPNYVVLLRAAPSGSAGFLLTGRAGAVKIEEAVKSVGGTLDALIPLAGRFDAVLIAHLSDEAVLGLSHAFNAGGWYAEPLRAYLPEEVDAANALFPQLARGSATRNRTRGSAPRKRR